MYRLRLLFLGSPRAERDGEPIEVDTRKAIALLAYLAVTAEPHARDTLATLLWPEYDQTRARANLRRTLPVLNTSGAGPWLEVDRETLGLRQDDELSLDVGQFRQRLTDCETHGHPPADVCPDCLASLTEAVELYRDDFLAGFTLRDSPEFDDWQFFQTERLRRELAGALARLVRGHSDQGQFKTAIDYAQRWLALDPLHEPAHRQLMQLHAWAGDRSAALRQYRDCVRILDEELGVPPLEETTQLYEAIKEQSGGPQEPGSRGAREISPVPLLPASRAPMLPLVGRGTEWTTLLETYAATGPNGHLVIVEGEAGIGKTRLAEEFRTCVAARGAATIAARCYEGEANLAYGLLVEGLRSAISKPERLRRLRDVPLHWLSEAARLLPELSNIGLELPAASPLDSPGARSRFFEGVSQVVLRLCDGALPGVLFLDDVHWADDASLEWLTYLVRRLRGRSLYVLITCRTAQLAAGHALHHLFAEAQRAGTATRLTLSRLSRSAVSDLVETAMPTDAELLQALTERLYRETEGLPFFVTEYLMALSQAEEGASEFAWPIPGGVRDLLHSRLSPVSGAAWQLLNTAAVIGRSFDFDTLRGASGRSEEEAITGLEALIAQGLVREAPPSGIRDWRLSISNLQSPISNIQYDFSHEKVRELVYEETSLARRRLLHRRVAEALASRRRVHRDPGSLAGQIAHHYQLAGQDVEAAGFFKQAGDHARTLYANREALNHYQSALALGHPDAVALHKAIGDVQTLLGEYSAALTAYETAAALCDAHDLARIEHKLGQVYQRRGEWELAESHFGAALASLDEEQDTRELSQLFADWSLTAHRQHQADRARELAHRGLNLAATAGDTLALAQAHNILGILARSQGDLEAARRHLEHSLDLSHEIDDPGAQMAALNNLALVYGDGGDVAQALEPAEKALALCRSQGDRHREAAIHTNVADLLHAAGQSDAAMAHLKQAALLFADIGQEAGDWQPEIWKLVEW